MTCSGKNQRSPDKLWQDEEPVLQGSAAPLTFPNFQPISWSATVLCFKKTSLKVLVGFWVTDGISSPQGENQNLSIIFHLLKTTNQEQAGLTSMSGQPMRRVTLTNPSTALMGSTPGTHAGGRTSALHLHRLNKHVRVRGRRGHWESAPSDDNLAQAIKWERWLFRGDCESEAAVTAKDEFPHKKIESPRKKQKLNQIIR